MESLDKDYGQFLEVRSSKELLAAMIPTAKSLPTIKAWGEDYVFYFRNDTNCDPQSFLEQLPLEFSDFSLFLSQIENAKDWSEKGLYLYKRVVVAIEKVEFIKEWVRNPEQAISLTPGNTEADCKQYEKLRSDFESAQDNFKLQLEATITDVQSSLIDGRYVSLFQFVDDFERWFTCSIIAPIQEMNRITKLPALRAEEEKQRQVATEAAKVEAVLKKKNDRRNYGSSNYSSFDSSSSSSSSGDYSSGYGSSSYDSGSSGSDYSSGSGGSDY